MSRCRRLLMKKKKEGPDATRRELAVATNCWRKGRQQKAELLL